HGRARRWATERVPDGRPGVVGGHVPGPGRAPRTGRRRPRRLPHGAVRLAGPEGEAPVGARLRPRARAGPAPAREPSGMSGLDRDTYRRVDGCWRIANRRYRSIARFPSGEVFPLDAD